MVKNIRIGQSAGKHPLKYGWNFTDYRKQSSLYLTNITIYGIIHNRIRRTAHEASRVHEIAIRGSALQPFGLKI